MLLWMRGAGQGDGEAAEDIRCQGERGQADVGERDRLTPRSRTRCYSARNRQAKIGIQAVTIGSRPHDQTKRG